MRILISIALFVAILPRIAFAQTWIPVFGPLGDDVEGMGYCNGHIFIGTDTGSFVSTDNGSNWPWDTVGLEAPEVFSFLLAHNDIVLAGTETAGIFRTSDYGLHWQPSSNGLPKGVSVPGMVRDTGQNVIVAVPANGAYLSRDNGLNWELDTVGLPNNHSWSLTASKRGDYYLGLTGAIARSADHGSSWSTTLKLDTADEVLALAADSIGNVFAGTFHHAIWMSPNDGTSWLMIDSGATPVRTLTIFQNIIFAGTYGSGVLMGEKRATDWWWTSAGDGLEGDNLKVLSSAVTPDGYLFAGTLAERVYRISVQTSSIKPMELENSPVLALTREGIKVSLLQGEEARLQIIDMLGREDGDLWDGFLGAGKHTFSLSSVSKEHRLIFVILSIHSGKHVIPVLNVSDF